MMTPESRPTVSVVFPCYNAARYVGEAVASVLAQTYTDFELIALDDGSTDGTLAILEAAAAADPRVLVVAREHEGLVPCLNEGLRLARGEYIARMDADDICLPERFARQVAYLDAHPGIAIVGSRALRIDDTGEPISRTMAIATGHEAIVAQLSQKETALIHPAVMARRQSMLDADGYWAKQYPGEDSGLWRRMAERGSRFANLPEPLIKKRRHLDAVTVQWGLKKRNAGSVRFHTKVARHAAWQGFRIGARRHAWLAWRAERGWRALGFAVLCEVLAWPALVRRRFFQAPLN